MSQRQSTGNAQFESVFLVYAQPYNLSRGSNLVETSKHRILCRFSLLFADFRRGRFSRPKFPPKLTFLTPWNLPLSTNWSIPKLCHHLEPQPAFEWCGENPRWQLTFSEFVRPKWRISPPSVPNTDHQSPANRNLKSVSRVCVRVYFHVFFFVAIFGSFVRQYRRQHIQTNAAVTASGHNNMSGKRDNFGNKRLTHLSICQCDFAILIFGMGGRVEFEKLKRPGSASQ